MADASFRSVNFPDRFIRHRNFLGELTQVLSDLDKHDATFTIVPGLADSRFISFRSVNIAGHFLRHQDFRLKLHLGPGIFDPSHPPPPDPFFEDATFIVEPGLADATAVSFRSLNFRDRFIRHRDFHLFVEPDSSPNLKLDATFRKEEPLVIIPEPPPPS
jgi:hypothetical protein